MCNAYFNFCVKLCTVCKIQLPLSYDFHAEKHRVAPIANDTSYATMTLVAQQRSLLSTFHLQFS